MGGRIPSLIRAEEVRGGGATVAGGGELGGGATERDGGREVRENGEGIEEVRVPYLAWARAQRGGVLRDGLSLGRRQWRVVAPEEQGRRWWFVVAKGGVEASL